MLEGVTADHYTRTGDLHGAHSPSSHQAVDLPISALAQGQQADNIPEVVWAPGKAPDMIAAKLMSLVERQRVAIAARIDPDMYAAVRKYAPGVEYNARARILKLKSPNADQLPKAPRLPGSVAVVSADTADLAVAEECRILTDYMGCYAYKISDVGTSNLHHLLSNVEALRAADVVIVVSGMDGSLPSIVAGITQAPVIAVPTSVGFGAALGGLAALLGALSSSTPGVTLVNIDNGYGAAAMAVKMLKMASRLHTVRSAAEAAQVALAAAGRGFNVATAGNGHHQ